jgi:hypothetical protein
MSKPDGTEGESAGQRLIREAREEAWHCRRRLRRELPKPTREAKWDLAVALADYHDLLSNYSTERALKTAWDERPVNVDVIEDVLNQVTEAPRPINRRGNAQQMANVPLVEEVDGLHLIKIGKELDTIAKELGFAPKANNPPPHGKASMGDLRGLLSVRGQGEALGLLPEFEDDNEAADAEEAQG